MAGRLWQSNACQVRTCAYCSSLPQKKKKKEQHFKRIKGGRKIAVFAYAFYCGHLHLPPMRLKALLQPQKGSRRGLFWQHSATKYIPRHTILKLYSVCKQDEALVNRTEIRHMLFLRNLTVQEKFCLRCLFPRTEQDYTSEPINITKHYSDILGTMQAGWQSFWITRLFEINREELTEAWQTKGYLAARILDHSDSTLWQCLWLY